MYRVYPGGKIMAGEGNIHRVEVYHPNRGPINGWAVTDEGLVLWDCDFAVVDANIPKKVGKNIIEKVRGCGGATNGIQQENIKMGNKACVSKMVYRDSGQYVHSFLDCVNNITTDLTKEVGIRNYVIYSPGVFFVGDYILKWSDDGCNKVIYKIVVVSGTTSGRTCLGKMRDLIKLDEVDQMALRAISVIDDAATLKEEASHTYCMDMGER